MHTRVRTAAQPVSDVRFCLVFPRETISVPVVRHVLGETLTKLGVGDDSVSDLLLAVTEACTNVLRHSGPGRGYEVVAAVGRNHCVLQVVDNGRGFDPALLPARRSAMRSVSRFRHRRAASGWHRAYSAPLPAGPSSPSAPAMLSARRGPLSRVRRSAERRAIAELPESGRGLAIMRAFVDDVTLHSRPGRGTVVSLAKRIELRSDAPLAHPDVVPLRLRDAG
jgi:anti-sigma regulatory factor (Ser/Thr protein kinase)